MRITVWIMALAAILGWINVLEHSNAPRLVAAVAFTVAWAIQVALYANRQTDAVTKKVLGPDKDRK